MLTYLTRLTNLLTRNSHVWPQYTGRQQIINFFSPKMSRQLSVVNLIQQHLLTKRWHHQSRLLFWAFKDQLRSVFGHNMKLSMIPTCSPSQLSSFQHLKDPTWPDKHVPRKMVLQPTMKQRIRHDPNRNNTRISILTTSWMVISHPKCWTINW